MVVGWPLTTTSMSGDGHSSPPTSKRSAARRDATTGAADAAGGVAGAADALDWTAGSGGGADVGTAGAGGAALPATADNVTAASVTPFRHNDWGISKTPTLGADDSFAVSLR